MSGESPALANPTRSAAVDQDNPWPGLVEFREADQEYFRGRSAETQELFRLVMREQIAVLLGLSGLGKSSLLQAGLFPMLRPEQVLPVYVRLDFSSETADLIAQIMKVIEREMSIAEIEAPAWQTGETLWEYFHHRNIGFWDRRNRPIVPLLVFDQFEEIFTLGQSSVARSEASREFLEQLADLAENRPPTQLKTRLDEYPEQAKAFSFSQNEYKILLSIREDFLPELEALRSRIPSVALNRLRLGPMSGRAALLVVGQFPALVAPDVAEQIVRFVAADRGGSTLADLANLSVEPALLSVVCRELNNKRRRAGEARITTSLLQGSQEQVLTELYDSSLTDLPNEMRWFIEERLITASGYRDTEAMENALAMPGVTRKSIERLVERRIIRREDRGGVERLELTHDLLTGVVRASRDRRREIEAAERQRLELERSQEQQKRARQLRDLKRMRIAAALFLLLTLIASGATWEAVRLLGEARSARSLAEASTTQAERAGRKARYEEDRANAALEMIKRSLLIRQAALSGDQEGLRQLLATLDQNSGIRFTAKATDLRYKNPSNQEVYNFELYPELNSVPTGENAVAIVTYLADHPTFRNTLLTAGPGREFRASYIGWGCLSRIVALVEYKDPTKPPTVTEFNMCQRLGWN